ncbi:hypothetical protein BC828DRAFT_439386 [Blastocladiella britannica]|nr:hypothetical protein BC828DRAFT_439386 [Blastocladiella britannica]
MSAKSALMLTALALLACVAAAIDVTLVTPSSPWIAGQINTFVWSYNGDVTNTQVPIGATAALVLLKANGNPNNATPVLTLASNLNPTIESVNAMLPIILENGSDYSLQWQWTGLPQSTWRYSGTVTVQGGRAPSSTAAISSNTSKITAATSTSSTAAGTVAAMSTGAAKNGAVALGSNAVGLGVAAAAALAFI